MKTYCSEKPLTNIDLADIIEKYAYSIYPDWYGGDQRTAEFEDRLREHLRQLAIAFRELE